MDTYLLEGEQGWSFGCDYQGGSPTPGVAFRFNPILEITDWIGVVTVHNVEIESYVSGQYSYVFIIEDSLGNKYRVRPAAIFSLNSNGDVNSLDGNDPFNDWNYLRSNYTT